MGRLLNGPSARYLLPDAILGPDGRLEEGVGLALDRRGRVLGRLPAAGAPAENWERFPGETWTAAPVLAHAHLDAWDAPAAAWPRASFAAWVRALLAWRASAARLSDEASADAACARLAETGCARIGVHAGGPGERGPAGAAPDRFVWREVLDPFPAEPAVAAAARWRRAAAGFDGLALHAPYSVDPGLAREVFANHARVSLHLGESDEERRCLARGEGPLAELLAERRGRAPAGRWPSAVAWLAEAGGLRAGTLAVHGGDLRVEELRSLRRAGVALVFCPGTHAWFERPAPAFAEAGVFPDALGCDSRASNQDLDPLREFRLAVAQLPAWPHEAAWAALTAGGNRALGRPPSAGSVRGTPLRVLRLADPRLEALRRVEKDPQRRAAALLRWLAATADPIRRGARIPDLRHA